MTISTRELDRFPDLPSRDHAAEVAHGDANTGRWRTALVSCAVGALLAGSLAAGVTASSIRSSTPSAAAGSVSVATPAATGTTAHDHAIDEPGGGQADQPLDVATRTKLGNELVAARVAATQYPTVKDARAAGLLLAGGLAPGSGAHFQVLANTDKDINPDGTVNPSLPASYIYAGVQDGDPLVGLMYISMDEKAPEGFAGPNDHWHRHSNVCFKVTSAEIEVPFAADADVTKELCDKYGGRFAAKTVWMVHAWVVPGWESPEGVFSHEHPAVRCKDGSVAVDDRGLCISA